MPTHYLQNAAMAMCDAQQIGGGNKCMIFCGGMKQSISPVLCFRSCSKFFDLKNVGSSYFMWDCGAFWGDTHQKKSGF